MVFNTKKTICKHCGAENKHHSFQCFNKPKKQTISKPKKPIAKFSTKKLNELKEYRKLRDKYFKENPICQFPGCHSTEISLHHARGRIGANLTDISTFRSLCLTHHRFVEENPEEAIKLGLSEKRI